MSRTFLISMFLLCSAYAFSLANFFMVVDSSERTVLKHKLAEAKDDTTRVLLLCRKAYVEQFLQNDDSRRQAEEAHKMALLLHFPRGIWQSDVVLSTVYFQRKDFTKAFFYYEEGLAHIDPERDYDDLCSFRSGYLNALFFIGDYTKALTTVLKAQDLAQKHNDKKGMMASTNLLGFIHIHQGNIALAKKNYLAYLDMATAAGEELSIANAHGNLADVFNEEKNYDEAIAHLKRSLDIYIRSGRKPLVALTYSNLGRSYKLKGDLITALNYVRDAIDISVVNLANKYELAAYYLLLGEIHDGLGQDDKAVSAFRKGLKIATEIGHKEDMKDAFRDLSLAFEKQGRADSAFFYYKQYAQLKDSLLNEKSIKEVNDIQARYDAEKKDKEILLLNKQSELAESNARRSDLLRNSIIAIVLLLAGMAWLLYQDQQLKQKNRFQAEINKKQNELFNAVVTAQEKERKRIAENLHDGVGSLLSAVKLNLERMEEGGMNISKEQLDRYQGSLSMLNDAVSELRNVSHNIMPAALSKLGLAAALRNLFDRLSGSEKLRVEFITHGLESRLPELYEIGIYHIILELVNNIVRHSAASQATVQLIRYGMQINITVEDNGKGFDPARQKKGIGLDNIMSRVQYLGGRMDIDSSPGNGTTILIELPVA